MSAVNTFSLQSGSNGNSVYVEADGVRLLFDAGISGKQAELRMAEHGLDIREVDALIISHDHSDHVRCAGIYQRKFGIPIYMTQKTYHAASRWCDFGKLDDLRHFKAGERLTLGEATVHTFPTAHDAVDGVAFVVEANGKRLGVLTDLGSPSPGLARILKSVDAAYLECNYDPGMLERGSYPAQLKARIRGPRGHLSNDDSALLIGGCGRNRPGWIAVAHLSEDNNRPELAVEALRGAVGHGYPVHHASRYGCSELLRV